MASGARQTPNLLPNDGGGEPVLRVGRSASADAGLAPLRLAIVNAEPGTLDAVRERQLTGISVVPVAAAPDLIWDAAHGQVVTGVGDVVAHEVDLTALPGVVGKWSDRSSDQAAQRSARACACGCIHTTACTNGAA